jgi:hypothetical protein
MKIEVRGDADAVECVEDGPGVLRIIRKHHAGWVEARKKST